MVCHHLRRRLHLQVVLYLGIFVSLSGVLLLVLAPTIYTHVMDKNLALRDNSQYFNVWKRTPVPPYMDVFLFNWTNPQDGHNASVKPRFIEVGPFRFREIKEKFNYTFNANNTISFRQKKIWFFDEAASCCTLDTEVTTLNAVLVTLSHKTKDFNALLRVPVSVALRAMSPDLYVRKPVRELLFDGYVDHLLATMKGLGISNLPEGGKFGFFHGKNDSSRDGFYNMDISTASKGLIREWDYATTTSHFQGKCAQVEGTTAEMYPPGRNRDFVAFFSGDMCRQLQLDYDRDESFFGLPTYRYHAGRTLLDNGTLFPENRCYCNGDCLPRGVLNVSACREGSPTFISLPHFLNADPIYVNNVRGLHPERSKHELYQVVEPITGLVLEANIRIQMNFHLKPIDFMPIINDVPNVMFPILWFQVHSKGTPEVAAGLGFLLQLPTYLKYASYAIIAWGAVMLIVGVYARQRDHRRQDGVSDAGEAVPLKRPEGSVTESTPDSD